MKHFSKILILITVILFNTVAIFAQEKDSVNFIYNKLLFSVFPQEYSQLPGILSPQKEEQMDFPESLYHVDYNELPKYNFFYDYEYCLGQNYPSIENIYELSPMPSPLSIEDGNEIIVAFTKNKKCTLIPVTIENGKPWIPDKDLWGKDKQLEINASDFPSLAKTGLHSESELDRIKSITGRPIKKINRLGLPGELSQAGFFSNDEDIISVLKGDNRLVKNIGLNHSTLAEPLFHVWNMIKYAGHDQIKSILYNGKIISIKAQRTKPGQLSLFNDSFRGGTDIYISRSLSSEEKILLKQCNLHLNDIQMDKLINKLTTIHIGEMEAYYIKRHGFYEGHTEYRADPIALSWIFGFKELDEIENALNEGIYSNLNKHYTKGTF